jgi:hypothetical protein
MMVKGVAYVSNLEADVVDAARGLGLEEVGDGRVLTERVEELELGVAQLYEHRRHAMLGQRLMSERVCERERAVSWVKEHTAQTMEEEGVRAAH